MKKSGSISEFIEQRDRELAAAFREILLSADMPLSEMFAAAAKRPCSRFWVGESRAFRVIKEMLEGHTSTQTGSAMLVKKQEMYGEILRRVKERLRADSGSSLEQAVHEAVNSPAPEFYITEKSARVIIYRIRRRKVNGYRPRQEPA